MEFIKIPDAFMVRSVETFDVYGQLCCLSTTHAISKEHKVTYYLPGAWVATGHVGGWRIAGGLPLWQVCLWIK
jgi:hypothetical protein